MDHRIEVKKSFWVIGKFITVSKENHPIDLIPGFWKESHQNGFIRELIAMAANDEDIQTGKNCLLGICAGGNESGSFNYWIAVESQQDTVSASLKKLEIPASTWAVFTSTGAMPLTIQDLWQKIFTEFLPGSAYKHAPSPEIEFYPEGDVDSPEYICEIWIPVEPK